MVLAIVIVLLNEVPDDARAAVSISKYPPPWASDQ